MVFLVPYFVYVEKRIKEILFSVLRENPTGGTTENEKISFDGSVSGADADTARRADSCFCG